MGKRSDFIATEAPKLWAEAEKRTSPRSNDAFHTPLGQRCKPNANDVAYEAVHMATALANVLGLKDE